MHIKSLTAKSGSSLLSKLHWFTERCLCFSWNFFHLLPILVPAQFPENETMISLCYWILHLVFSVFSMHVPKVNSISCELLWNQSGWHSHRHFFPPPKVSCNNQRARHTLCSFNKSLQFWLNFVSLLFTPWGSQSKWTIQ